MSRSQAPMDFSVVVATLRRAGCVFAEDEARLLVDATNSQAELAAMLDRRVSGVPLEHILGWVEFFGRRVAVDPGVFVPRRRSEFLVRQAASLTAPGAKVVDMCCGSGALGVALAAMTTIELYAVDVESAAIACARRNVSSVDGRVFQGDLFDPLPAELRRRVDVVIANAPYVPTDAIACMPAEARLHEPHVALDGGADGLDVQRRIIAATPEWLTGGGVLLIETGQRQATATTRAFDAAGFRARVAISNDDSATVVIGTWRRPANV
ncbi:putative protein N(5)-glutamine methyltransferase [Antrihabitans cavernicola]|uniref:peptide chain release factor N(5)-glutamine methyltransferase n=1 Tax=Antrihabitans cavernicola TaxID=2495913 RepID=A0A5A7S6F2_9NOCA|nr:putative protein N(5)-glutamine methyltransferase [Spelaeibacter cavernicola]KAA0019466.1 putative protein N(5)-glutamine methyltransferase [Spelaeibacter cavernicola]